MCLWFMTGECRRGPNEPRNQPQRRRQLLCIFVCAFSTPSVCVAVRLLPASQHAPHLYGSAFGKLLAVWESLRFSPFLVVLHFSVALLPLSETRE